MSDSRAELLAYHKDSLDIAVVGMDCRFPGSADPESFWRALLDARPAVSFFTDEQLRERGVPESRLSDPRYVKAGNVLADIDRFDAEFFGISPREAELMDPQHRVLLEVAWTALERAGCDPRRFDGLIGVYAGASASTYLMVNLASHARLIESAGVHQLMIGNIGDFLATRISYKLGLEGPSITVQSACSTSLVAVALACQALTSYQCDLALAGGVAIDVLRDRGYQFEEDGLFSPDGYCRSYDSDAQGTVGGNGAGMVALRRMHDALRDGDHIHAVIKGSALNNDGARRAGFTAPSAQSQAVVITTALASADVEPDSIGYVEGHGTATILGDPIEVAALNAAFGRSGQPRSIALGSVKPNIGHLDAASGIAGLIKAVLAVEHGQVPATPHFQQPNPRIQFDRGPFFVNERTIGWPKSTGPRRAAVSSFGLGGTNAHVVLEQAPSITRPDRQPRAELFVLSAKTEAALDAACDQLAGYLRTHPDLAAADVALTLREGRRQFAFRRTLVAQTTAQACEALEARTDGRLLSGRAEDFTGRPAAFMFTGFGDQYPTMARQLYQEEPVFRAELDRCADIVRRFLGDDLLPVLFSKDVRKSSGGGIDFRAMVQAPDRADHQLHQPSYGYPALFCVEYALVALWRSWGITPAALMGHSLGELVAATVSGVFTLQDALRLAIARARLIEQQENGAMLAVPLSERAAARYLSTEVTLAAVTGPLNCVLSGRAAPMADLASLLTADGIAFRQLPGRSGFHSPLMDPVVTAYRKLLDGVSLRPPQIPLISNTSGTWLEPEEATSPDYWARHMREPVRLADGVAELFALPDVMLIEIGPGRTLCTAALQHPAGRSLADRVVVPSLPDAYDGESDRSCALRSLGRLWLAGTGVRWDGLAASASAGADAEPVAVRVPLPGYPFQRRSYWLEPVAASSDQAAADHRNPAASWLWVPSWRRLPELSPDRGGGAAGGRWLVFADHSGLAARLTARLREQGAQVVTVTAGTGWRQLGPGEFELDPAERSHYDLLAAELRADGGVADHRVLHCWTADARPEPAADRAAIDRALALGFHSLTSFLQAVEPDLLSGERQWHVLTDGACSVTGEEALSPATAAVTGLCKVIGQEYPNLRVGLVDITGAGQPGSAELADRVLAEIGSGRPAVVALRRHRWEVSFAPVEVPAEATPRLREEGVYLITGGLGRIGLVLASHLARTVRARLVLAGRTGLPPRVDWDDSALPEQIRASISAVRELEEAGAQVLILAADVSDQEQASGVVARAVAEFGRLDGVIHCAGSTGSAAHRVLTELGSAEVQWHFGPKIHAVSALSTALAGRRLDFAILCSSVAAVLGGLGFAAYASANAYLDAFAQCNAGWTSVNWEAWRFGDEAAVGAGAGVGGVGSAIQALAISPQEGRAVFDQILSVPAMPQIIVSTSDIAARARRWADPLRDSAEPALARHARPLLSNPYVEPGTATERLIADVWADLLGVDQVGVHDNFFEVGGSSLLGLQIVHRLRSDFQLAVPLTVVYEGPTVRTLAALVDQIQSGAA